MRVALRAILLAGIASLSGCVLVQTGVTNPVPGMTSVAVAPFANLSAERSVDGRRFALAYHAELQKIPGFQVVPVGVTERAMIDLGLDLDGPEDALKLAEELGVDAVVIGAVTDYNPYYPPRIGLQVSWFTPQPHRFVPGIPTDPELSDAVRGWRFATNRFSDRDGRDAILRAQSPDGDEPSAKGSTEEPAPPRRPFQLPGVKLSFGGGGPLLFVPESPEPSVQQTSADEADVSQLEQNPVVAEEIADDDPFAEIAQAGSESSDSTHAVSHGSLPIVERHAPAPACPPDVFGEALLPTSFDPREPVMSYTRLFDGSDAGLTALLRDYVLLSGDLRSGGWEAYLHRSEDFIRFTSHRMIVEMLTLHGGESKRRYIWLLTREHH